MNFLKEYKKLNCYGKLFGIKRKFFESNKKYSERLRFSLLKGKAPELTRTRKRLLETLKEIGFVLDDFKIVQNYKKERIYVVLEIL